LPGERPEGPDLRLDRLRRGPEHLVAESGVARKAARACHALRIGAGSSLLDDTPLFTEKLVAEPRPQPVRQIGAMGKFDVFANVTLVTSPHHADRALHEASVQHLIFPALEALLPPKRGGLCRVSSTHDAHGNGASNGCHYG
jgi:hypothetical protein